MMITIAPKAGLSDAITDTVTVSVQVQWLLRVILLYSF